MVGKSLTIRSPIPKHYEPVASFNNGALIVAKYQTHPTHAPALHLFVDVACEEYDHVGSASVESVDPETIDAFVADRVKKLAKRRRLEIERLESRLDIARAEAGVYEGRPRRDPEIPASVRKGR